MTRAAAQHNSPEALIWLLKAGCPYELPQLLAVPVMTAPWARRSLLRQVLTRLETLDKFATASPSLFSLAERWRLLEVNAEEWEHLIARFRASAYLP